VSPIKRSLRAHLQRRRPTAAIWHNDAIGKDTKRSLLAYDH
jgi:hypothetical protein